MIGFTLQFKRENFSYGGFHHAHYLSFYFILCIRYFRVPSGASYLGAETVGQCGCDDGVLTLASYFIPPPLVTRYDAIASLADKRYSYYMNRILYG